MRLILLVLPFLSSVVTQAANILLTNDDGWAEINIRVAYDSLTAAGNSVILSAPAEDNSGTSILDSPPKTVDNNGCEFSSCRPNSPATGFNSSNPRLNYVNSFPVTSMRYGVQTLAPKFFNGNAPDFLVSGPNVGGNTGLVTMISGTVSAASRAAADLNIPSIAFSGASGKNNPKPWTTSPPPDYALIYADLIVNLTSAVLASGTPYLPPNTFLNVNFPAAGAGTGCTSAGEFKWVLSRIYDYVPIIMKGDVETCGNGGVLPKESDVVDTKGCYASVSVGRASDKNDGSKEVEAIVLQKLGGILSCLPSNDSDSDSDSDSDMDDD